MVIESKTIEEFDGTQYEYTDYCIPAHQVVDLKTLNILGENGFKLVIQVPFVSPMGLGLKGEMMKQLVFVREKVFEPTPEEIKEMQRLIDAERVEKGERENVTT
jgi:hypothetical protein